MIQRWIITPPDEMIYKVRVYKHLTNGAVTLRRAEIQKARLELQREHLELQREKQRNKSSFSLPRRKRPAIRSATPRNARTRPCRNPGSSSSP